MFAESVRSVGMDIHKHFVTVVGIDEDHQVIMTLRRVSTKQLSDSANTHSLPTDQVIREATTNV